MISRIISIVLILLIFTSAGFAEEKIKINAKMQTDFSLSNKTEDIIFKINGDVKINNLLIPKDAIIYAKTVEAQRERRWHKSGYILCKVLQYSFDELLEKVDVSDKDIYFVARRYEKPDKKEVSLVATELVIAQAASFVVPGVDIVYFFTKGAIQRKKDPNWFRAGVSNAYDNSICWFWLKGKPINLEQGDEVSLKGIQETEAKELEEKIIKRNFNDEMRNLKRDLKKEYRIIKRKEIKEIKEIKKELEYKKQSN